MTNKTLEFRWTVSRGRDTYGYNICSLWIDGVKVASCNGGGYDMQGTVLGEWLHRYFPYKLKTLPTNYGSGDDNKGFYGLSFYTTVHQEGGYKRHHKYEQGDTMTLDGACGIESMKKIAEAIGIKLKYVMGNKNLTVYTAEWADDEQHTN